MGGATFTSHSYTFTPGREVKGNFTAWFIKWWGNGMAEKSLTNFNRRTEKETQRSFERRIAAAARTKSSLASGFGIDASSRNKGKVIAGLIAGDLERNYIAMAAKRRRKDTDPDAE
jgi:hypothetical protein